MDFGRLITAMVTPFDEKLQMDWPSTALLIDYLIDVQKTDSLVLCGTTGESPTLSDEEKLQLFDFAVRHAQGRCKIIAGTGSNDTAHSISLTRKACELGVDGVLLVAPYYNRPSQEGLYQHFKAIAESVNVPMMLYNIPKRSSILISCETTIRLSKIPNIIASKEAHSDFEHITQLIKQTDDEFKVYSGDDGITLPVMSIGGYGVVSVASHIVGAQMKQMIQAYCDGAVVQAARLHANLLPVFKGLFLAPSPVPVKHALNSKGIHVGGVRLPLIALNDEEIVEMESLINKK